MEGNDDAPEISPGTDSRHGRDGGHHVEDLEGNTGKKTRELELLPVWNAIVEKGFGCRGVAPLLFCWLFSFRQY